MKLAMVVEQNNKSKQAITQCGVLGGNVYIRSKEYGWVPARLMSQKGEDTVKVAIPQYESEEFIMNDGGKAAVGFKPAEIQLEDYNNKTLPIANTGRNGVIKEVEDMADLPILHEAAILYNLKSRHMNGLPYCRIGSLDLLVAVNPYQWFPDLYDDQAKQQYAKIIVWDNPAESNPRIHLCPHVYEVSALCYRDLVTTRENQSILLCGESGSGKTETVKLCIDHLVCVQQGPGKNHDTEQSPMVRCILDSSPLLEAFGNAKTRHNDNASRFGRYTTLQFNHNEDEQVARAELVGSESEVFFLDKSRVVEQDDGERSFHIFYQLLGGPEEEKEKIWKGLVGKTAESFKYLGETPKAVEYGPEPFAGFQYLKECLARFGIVDESYLTLFRAICACLQLGNLEFVMIKPSEDDRCFIASKEEFASFCELIGCDEQAMETALTERKYRHRCGDQWYVPLNCIDAKAQADSFAKEIYAKTFLWLVRAVNKATCVENKEDGGYGLIGVLDIFGFQSIPVNGFEELCINYCNEKLQQKFMKDIFVSAAKEYETESLTLAEIHYDDNDDVVNLIEGKVGIIYFLAEETIHPRGRGDRFVDKARVANQKTPCLMEKTKLDRLEFGIHHYAGPVIYSAKEIFHRNRNNLPPLKQVETRTGFLNYPLNDILSIMESSSNEILSQHLCTHVGSLTPMEKSSSPKKRGPPRRKEWKGMDTVTTRLSQQLYGLMARLDKTKCRYIRCINPNADQKRLTMHHKTALRQLKAAGLVSAVTMAQRLQAARDEQEWQLV